MSLYTITLYLSESNKNADLLKNWILWAGVVAQQ